MLRPLFSGLLIVCSLVLSAQVIGYVDSVEVHRTDTIYFDFGSADLSPEAAAAVAILAADRPAALELYLEGHTDAIGSDRANDALAQRRSKVTLAAALAAGWPEDAVEIRHFGEKRLLVKSAAKEWRNRRVLLRSGLPKRYALFRGQITDEEGNPLPGGVIADSKYLKDTIRADDLGVYTIPLPLDVGVRLDIYAKGHFFTSHTMVLTEQKSAPPLVSRLRPATVGSKFLVEDLYFVGNRAELLLSSRATLPRVLQFVRGNEGLKIEISGHVNMPGERRDPGTWEYRLAENRARVVYDYLVHFGVSPQRMSYKGYSNYEMIVPKPRNEKEMLANRRVEIRVVGDGGVDN